MRLVSRAASTVDFVVFRDVWAVAADLMKSGELRDAGKLVGGPSRLSLRSLYENTVIAVGSAAAGVWLRRRRRADEPAAEAEPLCDYGKTGMSPFWIITMIITGWRCQGVSEH